MAQTNRLKASSQTNRTHSVQSNTFSPSTRNDGAFIVADSFLLTYETMDLYGRIMNRQDNPDAIHLRGSGFSRACEDIGKFGDVITDNVKKMIADIKVNSDFVYGLEGFEDLNESVAFIEKRLTGLNDIIGESIQNGIAGFDENGENLSEMLLDGYEFASDNLRAVDALGGLKTDANELENLMTTLAESDPFVMVGLDDASQTMGAAAILSHGVDVVRTGMEGIGQGVNHTFQETNLEEVGNIAGNIAEGVGNFMQEAETIAEGVGNIAEIAGDALEAADNLGEALEGVGNCLSFLNGC
ncbi:MAG: hypothetical protein ACON35_01485 [Candidatus Marinamargulisbacteria bacterium]